MEVDCLWLQLWLDLKLQTILSCSSNHSDLKEKERNTSSSIYLSTYLITPLFINPSFDPFTLSIHACIHTSSMHPNKSLFNYLLSNASSIHPFLYLSIHLINYPNNCLFNQLFIKHSSSIH